jgi:hypothetical protein
VGFQSPPRGEHLLHGSILLHQLLTQLLEF